jgi:Trypsin-like peptidase domain
MHERIGFLLPFLLALLASSDATFAACVDTTDLSRSTVSIMRHFDDAEGAAHSDVIGIRGTGWFLSPTTVVTVEHVTAAMKLSIQDWKMLEIVGEGGRQFIPARIRRLVGSHDEKLALIELQSAVSGAQSVLIRQEPLAPEEQVVTFAYPGGRPQLVSGRFVRFGDGGKLAGMALLELYEGENRLVIDHGASGAPVVDCDGRVAAVVSYLFTRSFYWASREIRFSTAWGMPNIVSVPIQSLTDFPEAR